MNLDISQRTKIYHKASSKWGVESQMIVACEEFAELIVEVAKHLNGKRGIDTSGLIDELADARIMIEQIETHYGASVTVRDRMQYKLKKLNALLDSPGKAHPIKERK